MTVLDEFLVASMEDGVVDFSSVSQGASAWGMKTAARLGRFLEAAAANIGEV